MTVQSKLLSQIPGIIHGFGTLDEPVPQILTEKWESARPRVSQIHGTENCHVLHPAQECGEVDSLFTSQNNIPIGVITADCVPILLAERSGKMIAAIHAGWRGTLHHITDQLWKTLEYHGKVAQNWVAVIGPCIGPCCFEVSEDLAEQFKKEFQSFGSELAVPKYRIIDLPSIHKAVLKKIGFPEVELISHCTRCSTAPQFHSYRREGRGTRQWSGLMKFEN